MGAGARRAVGPGLIVTLLVGGPLALVRWGAWPLDGGDAVVPGVATVIAWGIWGQLAYGLVRPRDDDPIHRAGRALLRAGRADGAPPPVVRLDEILAQVKVLVRVMGELDAVRPAQSSPHGEVRAVPARQKSLEALAYMALNGRGLSRQDLEQLLDVESATAVLSTVEAVGSPADDHPHLVLPAGVLTDYGIFCDLVGQAARADHPEPLLGDALALVRGEPFRGLGCRSTWAASHRDEMVARVVAAAEQLARLRLARGDAPGATDAAHRGLLAAPTDPRLTRLVTQAEAL